MCSKTSLSLEPIPYQRHSNNKTTSQRSNDASSILSSIMMDTSNKGGSHNCRRRKQATSHARTSITREHPEPRQVSSSFVAFVFVYHFTCSPEHVVQTSKGHWTFGWMLRQTTICSCSLLPHMLACVSHLFINQQSSWNGRSDRIAMLLFVK